MGREAGPAISLSQSRFTLNGYASDNISGVHKYCFNKSSTPDEYTDIEVPHTEQKTYTSSCDTETTYYFHVKDTAGNYEKAQTSVSLYTYSTIYINYYGNGGSGNTTRSSGSVQNYAWGGVAAGAYITLRSNGFTYSDHSFLGWDTNFKATRATYSANNSYYFSSTQSMYAIWKSSLRYHCNYCGQDTNDISGHYRCPTHQSEQTCSNRTGKCGVAFGGYQRCGVSPAYTGYNGAYPSQAIRDTLCVVCGTKILAGDTAYYRCMVCQNHINESTGQWAPVCSSHDKGGLQMVYSTATGTYKPTAHSCTFYMQNTCQENLTTSYYEN